MCLSLSQGCGISVVNKATIPVLLELNVIAGETGVDRILMKRAVSEDKVLLNRRGTREQRPVPEWHRMEMQGLQRGGTALQMSWGKEIFCPMHLTPALQGSGESSCFLSCLHRGLVTANTGSPGQGGAPGASLCVG